MGLSKDKMAHYVQQQDIYDWEKQYHIFNAKNMIGTDSKL
jgi:hypothetical protein